MLRAVLRQWRLWLVLFILACISLPVIVLLALHEVGPIRVGSRKYVIQFTTVEPDSPLPQGGDYWTVSGPPPYYDNLMWYRIGRYWFAIHIYNRER